MLITNQTNALFRAHFLRPIYVSLSLSVAAEAGLFLYFGVAQNTTGHLLHKFLWSVVLCGVGMGSVFGVAIILFILDRLEGWFAVFMTTTLAIILLGVGCNTLCFTLDQKFSYFGGSLNSELFLFTGWFLSIIGGLLVGILLFTNRGKQLLDKLGI